MSRDASHPAGFPLRDPAELAGVFMVCDPEWREKIRRGGWLLLAVPPIGWPAALGYRKELIRRLFSGSPEILPSWDLGVPYFFREGLKAIGVMFAHFLPLYLLLFGRLLLSGVTPGSGCLFTVLFFLAFPVFSPLSFPLIVLYLGFFSPSGPLGSREVLLFLMLFAAVTFIIPAGFLQVSRTGFYRSAFSFRRSLPFIVQNFRAYCSAWYHSIVMSLTGHFTLPFAPWGVFWCYLGIIYSFNSLLEGEKEISGLEDPLRSWFHRLREEELIAIRPASFKRVYELVSPSGDGRKVLLWRVGPIFVPVPALAANYLFPETLS